MTYFILLMSFLSFALSVVTAIQFNEACVMFRSFVAHSKSVGLMDGGYYQRLTVIERIAIWYLERKCELSYKRLPQGGYNVFEHTWDWDK